MCFKTVYINFVKRSNELPQWVIPVYIYHGSPSPFLNHNMEFNFFPFLNQLAQHLIAAGNTLVALGEALQALVAAPPHPPAPVEDAIADLMELGEDLLDEEGSIVTDEGE